MAILFERNGDWPDTDEDYRKIFDEEDTCFFCERATDCICDSLYDFAEEQKIMEELDYE